MQDLARQLERFPYDWQSDWVRDQSNARLAANRIIDGNMFWQEKREADARAEADQHEAQKPIASASHSAPEPNSNNPFRQHMMPSQQPSHPQTSTTIPGVSYTKIGPVSVATWRTPQ